MTPRVVTGADARYFAMACLLIQSLARWLPGVPVLVCDFGLNSAQRRFLEARGALLPRPPSVREGIHPYRAKAALVDYLPQDPAGADGLVVWLDCDMMAVAPLAEPLAGVLEAMGKRGSPLAACPDAEVADTAGFIARWGADVAPFAEAVRAGGIDPRLPYLNSGFFIASRDALAEVRDRCAALDDHRMIDQNGFNLTAWAPGRRSAVLNAAAWNVHGRLLAETVSDEAGEVRCGPHRALVLHATSVGGTHHEERQGVLRGEAGDLPITVKFFCSAPLASIQQNFFAEFTKQHRAALIAAGCYQPAWE
ncbi:hypothetical protein [Azospirillum soli]|uniref:hypothetical protein n=1 Tax=Azospirillum soli TaxID=1304799 RepID=UPI001AE5EA28|nr:hypothetical protein [Azospirillum soli]MBP2316096.1 hypothetical protein [Azospirillum soli]